MDDFPPSGPCFSFFVFFPLVFCFPFPLYIYKRVKKIVFLSGFLFFVVVVVVGDWFTAATACSFDNFELSLCFLFGCWVGGRVARKTATHDIMRSKYFPEKSIFTSSYFSELEELESIPHGQK